MDACLTGSPTSPNIRLGSPFTCGLWSVVRPCKHARASHESFKWPSEFLQHADGYWPASSVTRGVPRDSLTDP